MKKYIVFLFIFGLFFLGAGSVKAVSMSDLQNEIKSLSEQIVNLKSQLLGQVVSSRTATVVAPAVTTEALTTPVLTVGTKSTEVAQVQTALRNQGYSIVADGSFGAKTEAAVRAFQIAKSLPVTGKVDSVTRSKLVNPSTPTPACDPNADGAPWIKVTSPNGGETFTAGQQITITWQSCYMPANPRMNISIVNSNGTAVDERTDILVGNSQSIQYTLGGNYALGSIPNGNYKVWINFKDNSAQDYSDNFFTINNTSNLLDPNSINAVFLGQNISKHTDSNGKKFGTYEFIFNLTNNSNQTIYFSNICSRDSTVDPRAFSLIISRSNNSGGTPDAFTPASSSCNFSWLGSSNGLNNYLEPGATWLGVIYGVFELPTSLTNTGSVQVQLRRFIFSNLSGQGVNNSLHKDLLSAGSGTWTTGKLYLPL